MTMEQPKSGTSESVSEKVTVTVSDPPKETKAEPKICPECDLQSLYKMGLGTHWSCSNCKTQFLIRKPI